MTAAIVQGILDRFLRKYLKNVTTETATVWGGTEPFSLCLSTSLSIARSLIPRVDERCRCCAGQLVFKNVELRLDVLQVRRVKPVCRF